MTSILTLYLILLIVIFMLIGATSHRIINLLLRIADALEKGGEE